jgi:hypothetical protein
MSKSRADSYSQKRRDCRLDPIGDPLISGIPEPYPYSSGFSTGEVCKKALAWQQELTARVRKYQEGPDIPFEQKTEAANYLVNLAAEAAMAVEALSRAFPDAFRAVASKKAAFPVNVPVFSEDRDQSIRWLTEILQLGSNHELKLQGRKTFSRDTFANALLLGYIGRIKAKAVEVRRLRIQYQLDFKSLKQLPEEKLASKIPLSKGTAKEWMEVIWNLLLVDYPEPEKDERLRRLGARKAAKTRIALGKSSPRSEGANIRAGIRDALLKYLYRLLPDK